MRYRQLREAKPELFVLAGEAWQRWRDAIDDAGARFTNLAVTPLCDPSIYRGPSAMAARPRLQEMTRTQQRAVEEMAPVPAVCRTFAGELGRCQTMQAGVEARAAGHGFHVEPQDGAVIVPPGLPLPPGETAESLTAAAQRLADEVTDLLRRATQAELVMVDAMGSLSPQELTSGAAASGDVPPLPGPEATPLQVNQYWDGLTPWQQAQLISQQPARVGALDGVPVEARHAANMIVLGIERERLETRLASLTSVAPGAQHRQNVERARIEDQLAGISAIEDRLEDTAPGRQQAYLLGLDTADLGRAIVAIGNPDEADNVVTFVPGTTAKLGSAGGGLAHVEAMVDQAAAADVKSRTAGIFWLGYDAPQSVPLEATRAGYAEAATADLDRFQDGLRTTHEGPRSTNTVVGHSYGSTVVGFAARDAGLDVDNLVFVGSPGVGVDHADELGVPEDNVWATTAAHDPIQHGYDPDDVRVPIHPLIPTNVANPDPDLIHGNNPAGDDFGGRAFASDPGSRWPPAAAHSEYWRPESTSLKNFGHIIAGQEEKVIGASTQ